MGRVAAPHIITDDSALGGSVIKNSLRFNRNDITYLSRTPSGAGNRKTWTFSAWVKLGQTGVNSSNDPGNGLFLSCGPAGTGTNMALRITNNGYIGIDYYGIGGYYSTGRLRDPHAWYHCVWVMDTSESNSANRMKVYVNGDLFYNNSMTLSQNADTPLNNNSFTTIGVYPYNTSYAYRLDAYLTEVHFVDGIALDPSHFGYTDFQTGIWRPKRFIPTGPNNGVTWSSTTEFDANAFNGNFGNHFLAQVSNGYYIATTSPFTIKQSLGVVTGNGYHWGAKLNGSTEVTTGNLSGTMGVADRSIVNFDLSSVTLPLDVTNLQIKAGTGSSGSTNIYGIVIDGVILIDGDVSNIGLNGFHLEFKDNSSTSALGKDTSGNGNDFTTNNFAVSDSVPDTPTNNFATYDVLAESGGSYSEGNLKVVSTSDPASSTIGFTSGKFYFEVYVDATNNMYVGVIPIDFGLNPVRGGGWNHGAIAYRASGQQYSLKVGQSSVSASYGASYTAGDIIGCAVDVDNDTVTFYKNGVSQGNTTNGVSYMSPTGAKDQTYGAIVYCNGGNNIMRANFGQDSTFQGTVSTGGNTDANGIGDFKYAVPSGYNALCSNNLPVNTTSLINPQKHFDTILYTGNSSSGGSGTLQSISGLEFKPDLIWIKNRDATYYHNLADTVRGITRGLNSNATDSENNYSNIRSVNEHGFVVGPSELVNKSGQNLVAWCWKAGGATVTNNDGSKSVVLSANREAGFSIIEWSGNDANATVGHGLGKKPKFFVVKSRTHSQNWFVYHVGTGATKNPRWNDTASAYTTANIWNNTEPTDTVINLGSSSGVNGNGNSYICYCWTDIPGYSKFGVYKGNNNANGTYIHLGFRPAWVMIKNVDASSTEWYILDGARDPDNPVGQYLSSNSTASESTYVFYDFLSNGFKLRNTGSAQNPNNQNIIYMAFAEQSGSTAYATETNPR